MKTVHRAFRLVICVIKSRSIGSITECGGTPGPDVTLQEILTLPVGFVWSGGTARDDAPHSPGETFERWELVDAYQGDNPIPLDEKFANLDPAKPIICVINVDGSLESRVAAFAVGVKLTQDQQDQEAQALAGKVASHLLNGFRGQGCPIIATSQERHWLAPRVVIAMKRFFQKATVEIGRRLKENPTRREEGLTDELVFQIFSRLESRIELQEILAESGVRIEFDCEESGSSEVVSGADLGFCLTIHGQGLFSRRAILCQAKRLHPDHGGAFTSSSRFGDLLDGHGRGQATKMLDITACSYFLLYEPSHLGEVLGDRFSPLEARSTLDYSADGISVLPASTAAGLDRRQWSTVARLRPFCCSFVKFMVDDFLQGKVGDSGSEAVSWALTPGLRRKADLASDAPSPRFSIHITIRIADTDSERLG